MKPTSLVLLAFCFSVHGQNSAAPLGPQKSERIILLKIGQGAHVNEQDMSKRFSKACPGLRISSNATNYDLTLVTAFNTQSGMGWGAKLYDKDGVLIRSTWSLPPTAVKELCHALSSATLIEVVDLENLTLSSDLRGAPSRPGVGGVVDAIHGRRNSHTDNATLNVIANGEHALLDCY